MHGQSRSAEASPIDANSPQVTSGASRLGLQRSISEFSSRAPPGDSDDDADDVTNESVDVPRRRNTGGAALDGGASLLKHPSKAMERLLKSSSECGRGGGGGDSAVAAAGAQRPVLAFVRQKHDLDSLQTSMRQALRKAMCRVYALQAFNWLLRSVTQAGCIHDLLWYFTACLTQRQQEAADEEDDEKDGDKKKDKKDSEVCTIVYHTVTCSKSCMFYQSVHTSSCTVLPRHKIVLTCLSFCRATHVLVVTMCVIFASVTSL